MKQSYADIECIIVDDGTKDDCINKCDKLINDYEGPIQFYVIRHEHNLGLSAARNSGTKAATGDYIYYLDGDDEIKPDCIEKLMTAALEHPDAEMVIGNAQTSCDKKGRLWSFDDLPSTIRSNEEIASYYCRSLIPVVAWNKLIKRSFIEDHNLYFKESIIHEDYLWSFYVLKYLSVVSFVKEVTYIYCIRPDSISKNTDAYTLGNSFGIIYDEILYHLTPDRERLEMKYYVGGFCSRYLKYKALLPGLSNVEGLYRKRARHYNCWYVYILLAFTKFLGHFGHAYTIFITLSSIRRKLWCNKKEFSQLAH